MSARPQRLSGRARYVPDRPPTGIDLSDNTNLWGPPPAALRELSTFAPDAISRYPAPYTPRLAETIAAVHAAAPERVVVGCGSDDILQSCMLALGDEGDALATLDPTFSVIGDFANVAGLVVRRVELDASGTIDLDALAALDARLIYLCAPNNPTGTSCAPDDLRRLLDATGAHVLLDEAYADYAEIRLGDVVEHDRLVVVRTMSKAWGLAGLRIGFAIADPSVADAIAVARGPYKVSALAERVAIAALEGDGAWVRDHVATVRELRTWLAEELLAVGFEVLASEANFLAIRTADPRAMDEALRARGVLARRFEATACGGLLRITIGPRDQLEIVLEVLRGLA